MNFAQYWKFINGDETFQKARLSERELREIQKKVAQLTERGVIAKDIIKYLQKYNAKLIEKWRAERAYYTEIKRQETDTVKDAGEELAIKEYRILMSPHACKKCQQFTNNGKRIFRKPELQKNGWDVPPIHPNCYCILIPK